MPLATRRHAQRGMLSLREGSAQAAAPVTSARLAYITKAATPSRKIANPRWSCAADRRPPMNVPAAIPTIAPTMTVAVACHGTTTWPAVPMNPAAEFMVITTSDVHGENGTTPAQYPQ